MISIFDKILFFVRSRRPVFWIVVLIALLFIVFCTYFLRTYSIASITVKYNDDIQETAMLFSVGDGRDDEKISPLFSNQYLVKRDTIAIRATTENYSTIKDLPSGALAGTVTINLYKDKNAIKYSDSNPGCNTYDIGSDRLLSYSCTQASQLVEYAESGNNTPPRNKSIATIAASDSRAYSVKPYLGGVLSIRMPRFDGEVPTTKFLLQITPTGKIIEATVPEALDRYQLDATNVITDTASSNESNFLLVAKQTGKVYFSQKVTNDTMTYKEYSLPEDFSSDFDTLQCKLIQATAYCFYGYDSDSPDSHDETEHHKSDEKNATFLVINFESDTPQVEQYTTELPLTADELFVTQTGKVYTLSEDRLSKIELANKVAKPHVYMAGVKSVNAANGLYFIRDNRVYTLDDATNEFYMVFYSPKLQASSVTILNESVFVNAYIQGVGSQRIHTYKLTNESNNSPGFRLIDSLPLSAEESADISDMSLFKNKLFIRVKVTIKKEGKGAGVDVAAYTAAKKRITEYLQEKSINLTSVSTVFYY